MYPLDTLSSMQEARFPLTLPARLEERIAFYRRYLEAGLRFGRDHPDRYHLLVYEQLCQEPEHALATLMCWLGERFDPRQLAFNEEPRGDGLEDFKVKFTEGVHASSVGRWEANLAESDAALIWEGTRDLWEQVDPGLRWSYRQPQGCRP